MDISHPPLQSQERIAGILAYLLFIFPILMDLKTDFTMFHAKQSLILLVGTIIASFVPFFSWILTISIFFVTLWCMYNAYLGKKYVIPFFGENMDSFYSQIGILRFFSKQ